MNELSLFILDIAENSVDSGALHIEITVCEYPDCFVITVSDDGCGMDENEQRLALNTDYSTKGETRGHGLPQLKSAAEKSGGSVKLCSEKGKGTRAEASFYKNGSLVLGDINKTIRLLIFCHPSVDFLFRRTSPDKELVLDTAQIRKAAGAPINSYEVTAWIKGYLEENI